MRQAGDIYLNGKPVGLYENGVNTYGVDISAAVHFGREENVLAVKVDNRTNYAERASNTTFQWNSNDFNPDHGGINRHVWLHVDRQDLSDPASLLRPRNLRAFTFMLRISISPRKTADVTVESEVQNASATARPLIVGGGGGCTPARFAPHSTGDPVDMVGWRKNRADRGRRLKTARFWSPDDPYLYTSTPILKVDGKTVDVERVIDRFPQDRIQGRRRDRGRVYQ